MEQWWSKRINTFYYIVIDNIHIYIHPNIITKHWKVKIHKHGTITRTYIGILNVWRCEHHCKHCNKYTKTRKWYYLPRLQRTYHHYQLNYKSSNWLSVTLQHSILYHKHVLMQPEQRRVRCIIDCYTHNYNNEITIYTTLSTRATPTCAATATPIASMIYASNTTTVTTATTTSTTIATMTTAPNVGWHHNLHI